jgi:endonuclease YncB( thermonuclease family)
MKRQIGRALFAGALFVCALLGLSPAQALDCRTDHVDETSAVKRAVDGDTLALADGRPVRVIGVDTPEVAHGREPAEALGNEARDYTRAWLLRQGGKVRLRFDAERRDHYQRELAHVFGVNGESLEARLLAEGLASVLTIPPNDWNHRCYLEAERSARNARRGVWRLPEYQIRDADSLPASARGPHFVRGTVRSVTKTRGALRLTFSERFALVISKADRVYFSGLDPESLIGKTLLVRGSLHAERNRLRMNLRHPAALEVLR